MLIKKTIPAPLARPLINKGVSRFPWVLLFVVAFCVWFVYTSLTPQLPDARHPIHLYSNQCQQDLRATLLSAIRQASSSIHLVMFGLSDKAILNALAEKIQDNIPTQIFYDAGGSAKIYKLLRGAQVHPIQHAGLMHQKILVLDKELIFLGSANMTSASLKMHDNLVIGLKSRAMAKFLEEHQPYSSGYFRTMVGGQELQLWLLPDPRGAALADLRKKIRSAKNSIRIALFTLTHPGLIDEISAAHRRGIQVTVVIDMHAGSGASAKAVEALRKAGASVFLSRGIQLLHHKFIYIDEKTLVTGSANWTKAAFYKNSDCILAIDNLTKEQQKFMNSLWKQVASATQQ